MIGGLEDFAKGLQNYQVWLHLAFNEVRMKYRRTTLGPLWITASTGLTIAVISIVFSHLLGRNLREFVPFGAAGIITWYFIAGAINESCNVFTSNANVYRNMGIPFSYAIFQLLTRGLINFAHNFVIFIFIAIVLKLEIITALPWFLIGLCLVVINLGWISTLLAVIATRYRDIKQLVGSLITLLFLVTPIFWDKGALKETWVYQFNPFTYFIDVMRVPLIGGEGWSEACFVLVALGCVGWAVALFAFANNRHKIVFWL